MPIFKVTNPIFKIRDRYASYLYIPEYEIYKGDIVENPPWLSKDYISMTTGNPTFPVRSFLRERIVTDMTKKRGPAKPRPRTYKVLSSKRDKHYIVTLTSDNNWMCQCPGFEFRQTCRHIVEAQNRKRANAKK